MTGPRRLLVLALAACSAASLFSREVVITEAGAKPDGATVNTAAIQAAIDRCAETGGGFVVVPRGVFVSGALFFKPGVNLRVEKDGVLKATTQSRDFPPIYTRWEGVERYWTAAFLNFIGLTDVTVEGEGLIDGSGDAWPRRIRPITTGSAANASAGAARPLKPNAPPSEPKPVSAEEIERVFGPRRPATETVSLAPDPSRLPEINAAGLPLPLGPKQGRPRTLVFQSCQRVSVRGLHFKNEASWCVLFLYCENAEARDVTIRAEHNIPSSDGIDIDSSRHVRIVGCDIDCNDDCISIKSGKNEDGRRVARPAEDILVEKCRFGYGHGGVALGSETSGDIRRVEVRDCVAEAGNWAPVRLKSQPSRGGVIEDIVYRNFELRDARQAVEMTLAWRMVPPFEPPAPKLPVIRNVWLIGLRGKVTRIGSIQGLPGSAIRGIYFERCELEAESGLVLQHAEHIETDGLSARLAQGPVIRMAAAQEP